MLNAVQITLTAMYVHKGRDHCIRTRVCDRLGKRMVELATIGFYGNDGEWLNATISKFVATDPVRPGNGRVFVFSLWQASVNCILLQEYV